MALVQHHPALIHPVEPICSICIANYNGAALLTDCLESIYAQAEADNIEIIIHDDASSDESVALIRNKHPRVELIESRENVGFCVANNRMAELARGEFILLLNNDAALFPDAITTLLKAAHAQPVPGILTLPQYDWVTGQLVDRGCLLDPFYNPTPNLKPERTDVAMVIGACIWLPRRLWTALGGFPPWLGSIAEDLYLCCAARLQRSPVQVTTTSGYRHRQGASFGGNRADTTHGLQTTYRRRYLSERNKTAVMLVCTPTPLAWPWLALHILALTAEGAVLTALKRDLSIWRQIYSRALRSFFRELTPLIAQRKHVQQQRKITLFGYLSGFTITPRKLDLLRRYGPPQIR